MLKGIPEPKLRWFYKEKEKDTYDTLLLRSVKRQTSEGKYTCIATNKAGTSNATAMLLVEGKFMYYIIILQRLKALNNRNPVLKKDYIYI